MNRRILMLILAVMTLCLCTSAFAQEAHDSYLDYGRAVAGLSGAWSKDSGEDMLASRLLMRSKKAMTDLEAFGPTAVVAGPGNHYTLQFATVEKALECMQALKSDENVIYVQQDSLVSAYETTEKPAAKADPYLSWGAKAMGADDLAASINAAGSITVAVVDSGVKSHPFLNSRVKTGGVDFTNPTYKDGRNDVNGHGTHVAGTIVDLTQGLKVNILPVRVLGDDGSGSNSGVCNGIRYAAESGAKIINMSLGGQLFSPYEVASEEADAINYAISKGVTIVVAAGNDSLDTNSFQPACFDNVIVVAAIDSNYEAASFSNFGDSVDVCAPGVNITSCSINGGYTDFNGTSMASPHVAAIAAMVKLQNPGFSPARVENYIKSHCLDLGSEGWDRTYGNGMPCFIENDEGREGDYAYKIVEDGALITGYFGKEANVVVANTLGGMTVIGVEEGAFKENAALETLVVPGCVREIGNYAFADCALLKSVELQEGVERIGDSVFKACQALETVSLPQSLKNIGGEAFRNCALLKGIELPKGLEALGAYALSESGIKSLTVPASLGCLSSRMLADCQSLEALTVEEGITRIDALALDGCLNLKSLSLPKSVTLIGQAAFRGAGLESIDMPGVKKLDMGAFLNCVKLAKADLPLTLETVGELAFANCAALQEITLPEGPAEIPAQTFYGCKALSKVTIPRSVEYISDSAFVGCENLTIYGYTGSAAEMTATNLNAHFESIGYQVLLSKLSPLSEDTLESEPGQFMYVEELYTFEPDNATMTQLDWTSSDESVAYVAEHAYGDESYLSLCTIANGSCTVTGTAKDGSGLSIKFDISVGELKSRTVRLNKNTMTLEVGETAQLTATVLPASSSQSVLWASDESGAADVDDKGLVTALNPGVSTITVVSEEDLAISDMCVVTVVSATPVAGEFTIRALDKSTAAVTGYTGTLSSIDIPEVIDGYSIVMIDDSAFFKSAIKSVTFPSTLVAIGEKAFAECKNLTSAALPDSLTTLARDAFKGCKKLPKVKKIDLRLTAASDGFILVPVFTPANTASAYSVNVSNKKSATVSSEGLVTPLTEDYFAVTVKAGGKKAVVGVSGGEPYAASKVTIDGKAKRVLKMDGGLQLTYTVKPESARVIATWTSADPEIATVDQDGIVTPVAPGKVKITLDTDIGLSDSVTITVK